MIVTSEISSFSELWDKCWKCDGIFREISDKGLEQDFMDYLDDTFCEGPVDIQQVNDYIRYQLRDDVPEWFEE